MKRSYDILHISEYYVINYFEIFYSLQYFVEANSRKNVLSM